MQQPSREALGGAVRAMTAGNLTERMHLGLNELQNSTMHVVALLKGLQKMAEGYAYGRPCQLHTAMCGRRGRADEVKAADEPFPANDADLTGVTVRGDSKDRREARSQKESVPRVNVRFMEHMPHVQRNLGGPGEEVGSASLGDGG